MRRRGIRSRMPGGWAGFLRRKDGVASVEFVILVPVFLLAMIDAVEASVMMVRSTLLARGLDLAVRELRLGT